jgi:hypothetical protein
MSTIQAMRTRILSVGLALVLVGCGGSSDPDAGGSISSPCDLADATLVSQYFSGKVSDGVEGGARNCKFEITDGEVVSVVVYHYGDASGWEGTKSGFESNRGGVTEVDGIGDGAFSPNDRGEAELVVQSGRELFAVTVFSAFTDPSDAGIDSVAGLAGFIADDLC